jgi:tripartite-type tricarboxylate transporter receptor subunit TctC
MPWIDKLAQSSRIKQDDLGCDKNMNPMLRLLCCLSAFLLLLAEPAWSENWPVRPVRFVVSFAAGSTPDILCRLVTERIGRGLGQQLFVENRPGGGNIIGAETAARANSDGYTFFWATAAALVTNPYTFKSLPYDPFHEFAPVGKVAEGPFVVLANPAVPVNTLPELIAFAKAQPGKLTFATDGPRNFSGMIAAWINKLGETEIPQVPYATMPQGVQDAIAGRVQLVVLAIPSAAPFIQNGVLRALAISTKERAPGYEHIPPVADTFPGFDFSGWMAVVAPHGTSVEILQRMNREMDKALKEPEIVQRLREIGFYTSGAGSIRETDDFIHSQYEACGKVVREIGIQPE